MLFIDQLVWSKATCSFKHILQILFAQSVLFSLHVIFNWMKGARQSQQDLLMIQVIFVFF